MKKLLASLLAAFCLFLPLAKAANSATAKTALPISVWGATSVTPVEVVLDTTSSDLTIFTPDSGKMAAIVGYCGADTTAHNITFTSGSDAEFVWEVNTGSNEVSQICGVHSRSLLYIGQPGQAIKIQTSAAYTSPLLFYVIQADRFYGNK